MGQFWSAATLLFPQGLLTTDKDAMHWTVFWCNQGLAEHDIFHALMTGNEDHSQIEAILPDPKTRAIGIVVTKPDKIMHGMQLGAAGMHNQIRQWTEQPFAPTLFGKLIESGYRVFATSDHGNIEARGCGNPAEGMLAETRGQRARIYNHESIRQSVHAAYPDSSIWDPVGLPQPCLPLLAPHRQAFVAEKMAIVCHGGSSLAEMVVPLVEITMLK